MNALCVDGSLLREESKANVFAVRRWTLPDDMSSDDEDNDEGEHDSDGDEDEDNGESSDDVGEDGDSAMR